AAIVLGSGGVWGMHQIGNTALCLSTEDGVVPITINVYLTLASIVIIVLSTYLAFKTAASDIFFAKDDGLPVLKVLLTEAYRDDETQIDNKSTKIQAAYCWNLGRIASGAIIMALGVSIMHFGGVLALTGDFSIR
ncbi:unnamed protein product, partial [Discosporangium mesarthrocarpum]